MNMQEYRRLQVERTALEGLLERLPTQSVIERSSLEFRKSEVDQALSSLPQSSREPARVRLTFRGKPIVATHGVNADFGGAAVVAFTKAVAIIGASQRATLGWRGRIPNRDDYTIMITDTAVGSFGFEMEEPTNDGLFSEHSPVESAIAQTKSILEATVGTDAVLTNAVSETHPRALEALRQFLRLMVIGEAVCTIEFKEEVFQFMDVGQVRRSEFRLRRDNIREEQQVIAGRFLGALPAQRRFEFQDSDSGQVISGGIDHTIRDVETINERLTKPTRIRVNLKQVGAAIPSYVLLEYDCRDDLLGDI